MNKETWINELLEGSLRLVDLCGFSRDVVRLSKECIQDLESSVRRHKGETATSDMNAYVASRKKINKMVNKCIKNLKSFNQNSTAVPDKDCDLKGYWYNAERNRGLCLFSFEVRIDTHGWGEGKIKAKKLVIVFQVHSNQPCTF
ncbi:UNVERIFIED_CONTAM: hypothetical protein Scaly_1553300 [Sesamum calycinum]|uniref:Uncharacterized protein n=1 Tax=Sesamum calycinum TaxID=2727403 RepID=A0AAW2P834_9LAMI